MDTLIKKYAYWGMHIYIYPEYPDYPDMYKCYLNAVKDLCTTVLCQYSKWVNDQLNLLQYVNRIYIYIFVYICYIYTLDTADLPFPFSLNTRVLITWQKHFFSFGRYRWRQLFRSLYHMQIWTVFVYFLELSIEKEKIDKVVFRLWTYLVLSINRVTFQRS